MPRCLKTVDCDPCFRCHWGLACLSESPSSPCCYHVSKVTRTGKIDACLDLVGWVFGRPTPHCLIKVGEVGITTIITIMPAIIVTLATVTTVALITTIIIVIIIITIPKLGLGMVMV